MYRISVMIMKQWALIYGQKGILGGASTLFWDTVTTVSLSYILLLDESLRKGSQFYEWESAAASRGPLS